MKWSETAEMVFISNRIKEDDRIRFVKDLRLTLRLDYEMPAKEVRKLNDNKVIELWLEIHSRPENRIGGADLTTRL
jgi:hypothetical protein